MPQKEVPWVNYLAISLEFFDTNVGRDKLH
jgi:hypothetical protein